MGNNTHPLNKLMVNLMVKCNLINSHTDNKDSHTSNHMDSKVNLINNHTDNHNPLYISNNQHLQLQLQAETMDF
jgi:hypothetical protein